MTLKATVALPLLVFLIGSAGASAVSEPLPLAASAPPSFMALSKPFKARPGWRFTAQQGPEIADLLGDANDKTPGVIRLCISKDRGRTCRPDLDGLLVVDGKQDMFSKPHFLNDARIVHPLVDLPILLLKFASLYSGDGDQRVATAALRYDSERDTFAPIYQHQTGHNNNQEVRYIEAGLLRGAIISAEPTSDGPFGFWITVNTIQSSNMYRPILRYRSATRYGDGNPLAVIDSEMPNLQRRLGLWHQGRKLPLPAEWCPRPHLIKRTLWCSPETMAPSS